MVVKMLVKDSANTTKIEQNQEPIIGAAMKARLEQTTTTPKRQNIKPPRSLP
jgi:hypothetical protein